MQVELEIELVTESSHQQYTRELNEGEGIKIRTKTGSNDYMKISVNEVTQLTDIAGFEKECPVCGNPEDEIAVADIIGSSFDVDRICVSESEVDKQDFKLHFHL